ncbi:MAG: CDP-diacylglycerol--serine O-phosphatidyltransferase [Pseudomonadota bacterium]
MAKDKPNLHSIRAPESSDSADSRSSASENSHDRPQTKGIYVLPNLFTTAGLFAGFYAIMQARVGHFEAACLAIYAAMIMDIIDGRLARLTNTMSEFGSQYDSMSDMVSFGVAPALLLYNYALLDLGKLGSFIAFIFIACAAIRLARFNVASTTDKKFFTGVPSPGAAAMLATVVWVLVDYDLQSQQWAPLLAVLMVLLALAMVSNIKYRSFKDVEFREQMPFIGLILLVIVMAVIYIDPPLAFLIIGSVYIFGGASIYGYKKIKKVLRNREDSNWLS